MSFLKSVQKFPFISPREELLTFTYRLTIT